jgi:protein-S-isoprenylcysteine O-methyltransferase Ste14
MAAWRPSDFGPADRVDRLLSGSALVFPRDAVILPRGMDWLFNYVLQPALAVGLIVGFYWGRVIKLVRKTRKQTGRSAHLLPPETLGRIIRIVWYPTVAAWCIFPWLSLVPSSGSFLHIAWDVPAVRWLAATLAFVDLYLTMICWRRMGRDWRMGIDPNEKNNLIVTGPYAYVRHPIYALQIVLVWLTYLAVPSHGLLLVAGLQTFFLTWEAIREERHLVSMHGQTYTDYQRTTGRFIPPVVRRK